jgi:hypothetical protein
MPGAGVTDKPERCPVVQLGVQCSKPKGHKGGHWYFHKSAEVKKEKKPK